jgi:ADP-heptose:LPS heptosyltransferase
MKRLLFAETFRLGDCLYTAAVIDALKQMVDAEFHVIVSELSGGFDPLWEKMGVHIHRFSFPWEKSGWQFHPIEIRRALQRVRNELRGEFSGTHGFNPRGSFLQTQVLKASGVTKVTALEFETDTSFLWRFLGRDKRNIFDSRQHFLKQCIQSAGDRSRKLEATFLRGYINLQSRENRIILSPGASAPVRYWNVACWTALAEKLLEHGFLVEAVSHPSSNVSNDMWPAGVSLFSGGIKTLAERISGSRLTVSPDSFVAHLAVCCGAPAVVLFGPQDPALWNPPGATAVFAEHIPCRPCSQKLHRCPLNHRCMNILSPRQVFDAVIKETHECAKQSV